MTGCSEGVGGEGLFYLNDIADAPEPIVSEICVYDYDIVANS